MLVKDAYYAKSNHFLILLLVHSVENYFESIILILASIRTIIVCLL